MYGVLHGSSWINVISIVKTGFFFADLEYRLYINQSRRMLSKFQFTSSSSDIGARNELWNIKRTIYETKIWMRREQGENAQVMQTLKSYTQTNHTLRKNKNIKSQRQRHNIKTYSSAIRCPFKTRVDRKMQL